MLSTTDRQRLERTPLARLATIRTDGRPHLVPITFALDDDDLVTAVDHKPKRHDRLQRLANIRSEPRVCVLLDEWAVDWADLWWLRLDGTATVSDSDSAAVAALVRKYPHYEARPPRGPVIRMVIEQVASWSASG